MVGVVGADLRLPGRPLGVVDRLYAVDSMAGASFSPSHGAEAGGDTGHATEPMGALGARASGRRRGRRRSASVPGFRRVLSDQAFPE